MRESDPLKILLAHDRWAIAQMLDACAPLSDGQFHERFDMGFGSLHDTLTHMISALRAWTDTLAERPHRPRLDADKQRRTVDELKAYLETSYRELIAESVRRPLDETVTRVREEATYTFARGAVFTHVTTHGTHHRAQCLNMLKRLGVSPLPFSSVMEWTRATGQA